MNTGKRFEQQFKKSIPKAVFYYRFRDGTSNWGGNDKVRFQAHNICDCMIFDGDYLCLLELKSCKGRSLPLSNIRQSQIEELESSSQYPNINAGLVIFFSDLGKCFYLPIFDLIWFINTKDRKSIPIDYLEEYGLEIECYKKQINYTYNVDKFLKDLVKFI